MKKLLIPFCSIVLLATACKKADRSADAVQQENQIAENGRQCAADEVLQRQMAENPERARNLEALERKTETFVSPQARLNQKLYIPVVVHVVLPNATRVTSTQIQSQIAVLNKDFTKTNTELSNTSIYLAGYPYANVANPNIEFYVVQTIYKEASGAFGLNDAVKSSGSGGSNPVNPSTVLNLWVCDLSSGYLGYAQFPGGPASTDGVVIDYQCFGTSASYPMYSTFNLGRTATHEVGHWLNLRHIWGDRRCGNDGVSDTPAHDASNGGCPSTNLTSQCSGRPREQWMNYMDYTDDRCMYMFTAGQKTRMDAAIDGPRAAYMRTSIQ